jgi:hypothetical protein
VRARADWRREREQGEHAHGYVHHFAPLRSQ